MSQHHTADNNAMLHDLGIEIRDLSDEFEQCQRALTALGNPTRLHLIVSMLQSAPCPQGLREDEITSPTNLS